MALAPVYIFSSDDPFLKKEQCDIILAKAKQELPQADFLLFTAADFGTAGKANLSRLEGELIDPGLFGGDRIIKIYLDKLNAIALQVLHLLAYRSRPGVVVVVELSRINKSLINQPPKPCEPELKAKGADGKAKEVFSYLANIHAQVSVLYPPSGPEFTNWIVNQANLPKYKLQLERDALDYLTLSCDGNLVAVDQFFEIVKMSTKENKVTLDLAKEYLTQSSRYSPYEFIEAVLAPNSSRALNVLNALSTTESNKTSLYQSIAFAFDDVLKAIKDTRKNKEILGARVSYQTKAQYFRAYKIAIPSTIDYIIFAARNMPEQFLDYLVSELAKVSIALQQFDNSKALISLQNMAVSVQYSAIQNFVEL